MAHRQAPRREVPVVVEDEPPHEFYANLLGTTAKPAATALRRSGLKRRRDRNTSGSVSEQPPKAYKNHTPSAYERAFANPPVVSSLSLDASNKGFRLLSKMGWRETDGGLGRHRQGTLEPVRTTFKNDKKGLGAGRKKAARVTHTTRATNRETDVPAEVGQEKETKAARKRRLKREREAEAHRQKRARMMLRTDVSDEYEQLYMQLYS